MCTQSPHIWPSFLQGVLLSLFLIALSLTRLHFAFDSLKPKLFLHRSVFLHSKVSVVESSLTCFENAGTRVMCTVYTLNVYM